MSDVKEATGKIRAISEKSGGFREIEVDTGGNYPLKLSTKKQDVIDAAREALDWPQALLRYTEQDSGKENPNRPGTNFINRYLSAVLPVTPADAAKAAQSNGSSAFDYLKPRTPEETLLIVRQSSMATAFSFGAYALAAQKDTDGRDGLRAWLFDLADEIEARVYKDAPVTTPVAEGAAAAGVASPSGDGPFPDTDDSIPFAPTGMDSTQ